jgi:hypothetical protein
LLYEDVIVRSVSDNEFVTPMLAGIGGTTNNKYSEDLSSHTKRGLEQRREEGKPIGAVPFGYTVEKEIVDGKVISRRIVDENLKPVVVEMFERVADGQMLGEVARWINAQGIRTKRGSNPDAKTGFVHRTVRNIIRSRKYEGREGYPQIVDPDLAHRARSQLQSLDPSAAQRRKGGRPAQYMLRGLAFCAGCGAAMYSSRKYLNGRRGYVCSNKLQATGLCDRPGIPADVLETHVLNHLQTFIGSVQEWLAERVAERSDQARRREGDLEHHRENLRGLQAERDRVFADYRELLGEGSNLARLSLEAVHQVESEIADQVQQMADAEARIAEWAADPDIDAALDYYNQIVDAIHGRIQKAEGITEVNRALASVLAGLWCELDPERDF